MMIRLMRLVLFQTLINRFMVAPQKNINGFNHNIKQALRQTNYGSFYALTALLLRIFSIF